MAHGENPALVRLLERASRLGLLPAVAALVVLEQAQLLVALLVALPAVRQVLLPVEHRHC